jgi:hypothetical protein
MLALALLALVQPDAPKGEYVKKANRADTVRATLASHGLPNLEGKWYFAGPFPNEDKTGFDAAFPPEKKQDLKDAFTGKGGRKFGWQEAAKFPLGQVFNLFTLMPTTAPKRRCICCTSSSRRRRSSCRCRSAATTR